MIAVFGGLLAVFGAFCYALSSVAIVKSAQSARGRGNDVFLSIVTTATVSGGLWLLIGPPLLEYGAAVFLGVGYFVLAGLLGNVLGRLTLFRSVELAGAIETGLIRRLIPVFAAVLAFFFLGEVMTPAIMVAFLLVTTGVVVMMTSPSRRSGLPGVILERPAAERQKGRLLALGSAGGYGSSLVARKMAMQYLPDPLAGVFVGALTGLFWFGASAILRYSPQTQLRALLQKPSGWQLLAAVAMSTGQITLFFALMLADVTVVALISSVEMFFAVWLAAYVFKTENRPGRRFYLSSAMAGTGVILLALAPVLS